MIKQARLYIKKDILYFLLNILIIYIYINYFLCNILEKNDINYREKSEKKEEKKGRKKSIFARMLQKRNKKNFFFVMKK